MLSSNLSELYKTPYHQHTLLSELLILFCSVKILFPIVDFHFLFHRKKYSPQLLHCLLCSD